MVDKGYKEITIYFKDAKFLNSVVLSILLKLLFKRGVKINVNVSSSELFEILRVLGFEKIFNVKKYKL